MAADTWWRDGVLYQIYPRSFADSNGDGVGDLRGILARMDYLEWLGVDGIWLNPTMPSPNEDWGYDVADYCGVHPELGTLEDLDALVAGAAERGIRVLLDLVPNHTSDRHEWFVDALSGRDARHRDFYVWADPGPDGGPPNNWLSNFGGSAWQLHEPTGQYYLRNFLPSQPDLNWWNDDVREAFDDVLRFWFARGVAGLPDRRLPRDRQRPRAARRPGGDARRPPAGPQAGPQAGVLDEPARGARRAAALARARRRPGSAARAGGGDLRARPRLADPVLRAGRGRAQPRVQLPLRALGPRRRPAAARSSRASRRSCPRRRGRSTRAPTTTRAGSRRAGPAATSGARASR